MKIFKSLPLVYVACIHQVYSSILNSPTEDIEQATIFEAISTGCNLSDTSSVYDSDDHDSSSLTNIQLQNAVREFANRFLSVRKIDVTNLGDSQDPIIFKIKTTTNGKFIAKYVTARSGAEFNAAQKVYNRFPGNWESGVMNFGNFAFFIPFQFAILGDNFSITDTFSISKNRHQIPNGIPTLQLMKKAPGEPLSKYVFDSKSYDSKMILLEKAFNNFLEYLTFMNQNNCVHGDLHADNIFTDQSGQISIIDWERFNRRQELGPDFPVACNDVNFFLGIIFDEILDRVLYSGFYDESLTLYKPLLDIIAATFDRFDKEIYKPAIKECILDNLFPKAFKSFIKENHITTEEGIDQHMFIWCNFINRFKKYISIPESEIISQKNLVNEFKEKLSSDENLATYEYTTKLQYLIATSLISDYTEGDREMFVTKLNINPEKIWMDSFLNSTASLLI